MKTTLMNVVRGGPAELIALGMAARHGGFVMGDTYCWEQLHAWGAGIQPIEGPSWRVSRYLEESSGLDFDIERYVRGGEFDQTIVCGLATQFSLARLRKVRMTVERLGLADAFQFVTLVRLDDTFNSEQVENAWGGVALFPKKGIQPALDAGIIGSRMEDLASMVRRVNVEVRV